MAEVLGALFLPVIWTLIAMIGVGGFCYAVIVVVDWIKGQ